MHQKPLFLISCALLLLLGCFAGGLLPPPTTHAQLSPNWPPVGTIWVYEHYDIEYLPGKFHKANIELECLGDTMINDTSYRIIQAYNRNSKGRNRNEVYDRFLLRADSHRVYRRIFWQESREAIIQDFSLNHGDTLNIPSSVFGSTITPERYLKGKIIKKPDTLINRAIHRRYYLSMKNNDDLAHYSYFYNFIEGIGSVEAASAINTITDPADHSRSIRCYMEPGKPTVHFREDTNCIIIRVSRNDLFSEIGLELFPNPTTDYLMINGLRNSTNFKFTLLSTTGQTITLSQPVNERLTLPTLPTGVYLFQIKDVTKELLFSTKLIIQ